MRAGSSPAARRQLAVKSPCSTSSSSSRCTAVPAACAAWRPSGSAAGRPSSSMRRAAASSLASTCASAETAHAEGPRHVELGALALGGELRGFAGAGARPRHGRPRPILAHAGRLGFQLGQAPGHAKGIDVRGTRALPAALRHGRHRLGGAGPRATQAVGVLRALPRASYDVLRPGADDHHALRRAREHHVEQTHALGGLDVGPALCAERPGERRGVEDAVGHSPSRRSNSALRWTSLPRPPRCVCTRYTWRNSRPLAPWIVSTCTASRRASPGRAASLRSCRPRLARSAAQQRPQVAARSPRARARARGRSAPGWRAGTRRGSAPPRSRRAGAPRAAPRRSGRAGRSRKLRAQSGDGRHGGPQAQLPAGDRAGARGRPPAPARRPAAISSASRRAVAARARESRVIAPREAGAPTAAAAPRRARPRPASAAGRRAPRGRSGSSTARTSAAASMHLAALVVAAVALHLVGHPGRAQLRAGRPRRRSCCAGSPRNRQGRRPARGARRCRAPARGPRRRSSRPCSSR